MPTSKFYATNGFTKEARMKKIIIVFMFIVLTNITNMGHAEYSPNCDSKKVSVLLNKSAQAEGAGKVEEAYRYAAEAGGVCMIGEGYTEDDERLMKKIEDTKRRLALKTAELKEKKGELEKAIKWYDMAGSHDRAANIMIRLVKDRSEDKSFFGHAMNYFYGDKNKVYLKELEKIASARGDSDLAREEKVYSGKTGGHLSGSPEMIISAKGWYEFFKDPKRKNALDRAEKRGDFFFKFPEQEAGILNTAKEYYKIAENESKVKTVKAKANEIGDSLVKKGDLERAIKYYEVAENDAKVNEFRRASEKKKELSEGDRRKKFKKEQDKLEKELGL